MCVVNMVTKTPEMTNAMHFAKKFVAIVAQISKPNYDQYVSNSLKETTRDKRTAKAYPLLPRETTEGLDYASQ